MSVDTNIRTIELQLADLGGLTNTEFYQLLARMLLGYTEHHAI